MGEVRALRARVCTPAMVREDVEDLDAILATRERRADRARALMAAAQIVLLGYDDQEDIVLAGFEPDRYARRPGVRA